MRPVRFMGDSLKRIREFPEDARRAAGHELERLQRGGAARDVKPMPSIGPGIEEIRIWEVGGTFRVIYTARFDNALYVLHAFQKKTQQTSKRDVDLVKLRLAQVKELES